MHIICAGFGSTHVGLRGAPGEGCPFPRLAVRFALDLLCKFAGPGGAAPVFVTLYSISAGKGFYRRICNLGRFSWTRYPQSANDRVWGTRGGPCGGVGGSAGESHSCFSSKTMKMPKGVYCFQGWPDADTTHWGRVSSKCQSFAALKKSELLSWPQSYYKPKAQVSELTWAELRKSVLEMFRRRSVDASQRCVQTSVGRRISALCSVVGR